MLTSLLFLFPALYLHAELFEEQSPINHDVNKRNVIKQVPGTNDWANGVINYQITMTGATAVSDCHSSGLCTAELFDFLIYERPIQYYVLPAKSRVGVIKDAMKYISDRSCAQFIRANTGPRLLFTEDLTQPYCKAYTIGKDPASNNIVLSEGDACGNQVQVVVRYIMHAMGFYPMQTRNDAATYVKVTPANFNANCPADIKTLLTTPKAAADFEQPLPRWEYGSVLAYGGVDFSPIDKPVFEAVQGDYTKTMGTGRVVFGDIKMINNLYKCADWCAGVDNICNNGGFQNPQDCQSCICPDGFGGDECSDLPTGSTTDRTQGSELAATTAWQRKFIEFGQDANVGIRNEYMNRVDWIRAPQGKKVETKVSWIFEQCHHGCKTAGVELKTESQLVSGVRICCNDLVNKTFTSKINPMPVISYNRWAWTSFWIDYRAV